jgi:predicted membrane channel-forming protein YqfA (hemolysin III family)
MSTFIIHTSFDWLASSLLIVAWGIGLLVFSLPRFRRRRWEQIVLFVSASFVVLIPLVLPALQSVVAIPLGDREAVGLAGGLAVGLAVSLSGGMEGGL